MHQIARAETVRFAEHARLRTDGPGPLGEVADAKTRATVPRAVQLHEAPHTHQSAELRRIWARNAPSIEPIPGFAARPIQQQTMLFHLIICYYDVVLH